MVPILEPELLRYASVWPRVTLERLGEPVTDTWGALWACVRVDLEGLALLVNEPEPVAARVLRRLQAMHVIYPDGSVPELVRKVIGKRVQDVLKGGSK